MCFLKHGKTSSIGDAGCFSNDNNGGLFYRLEGGMRGISDY